MPYQLHVEEVNNTDIVPDHTIYRFYLELENTDDKLISVYGDSGNPLVINAKYVDIYNDTFGGSDASLINPAFIPFFPTLAADSWVTIGRDPQIAGYNEGPITAISDSNKPFFDYFDINQTFTDNPAMNTVIGGAWSVPDNYSNGCPDDGKRVLVMQLTIKKSVLPGGSNYDPNYNPLSGRMNFQIYQNGSPQNELRLNGVTFNGITFGGSDTTAPVITSSNDAGSINENSETGIVIYTVTVDDDDDNITFSISASDTFSINETSGEVTLEKNFLDTTGSESQFTVTATDSAGNSSSKTVTLTITRIPGCMDETACNYSASATSHDGTCTYPETGYDCDGNCLNDIDGDGICDELEVLGCTDSAACNYDATATNDDGSCIYATEYYDCDGNCLNDADGDGVCDELEVLGCIDTEATNYNPAATQDDGSCEFITEELTTVFDFIPKPKFGAKSAIGKPVRLNRHIKTRC